MRGVSAALPNRRLPHEVSLRVWIGPAGNFKQPFSAGGIRRNTGPIVQRINDFRTRRRLQYPRRHRRGIILLRAKSGLRQRRSIKRLRLGWSESPSQDHHPPEPGSVKLLNEVQVGPALGNLPAEIVRPGRLQPLLCFLQQLSGFVEVVCLAKTHGLSQCSGDLPVQFDVPVNGVGPPLGPLLHEPYSAGTGGHRQKQRHCHQRGGCWITFAPAPCPSQPAQGPSPDRTSLPKTLQIVGKRSRTFVTRRSFLLKAFEADRFQVARDLGVQSRRRNRLLRQDLPLCFRRCFGTERRPSGQQFVKRRPQRIDIGGRSYRSFLAYHLFGGHVAGCPDPGGVERDITLSLERTGQSKIRNFGGAVAGKQHVGGLQVTVNDAGDVSDVYSASQALGDGGTVLRGLRHSVELSSQTSTVDELHREVRPSVHLADVVDLHDIGMLQSGDRLGFTHEPRQFGVARILPSQQHFQGSRPLKLAMAHTINDSVAAPPQDLEHFITGDFR